MLERSESVGDAGMTYMGIDPDCDKSGVAFYDTDLKRIYSLHNWDLVSLLHWLESYSCTRVYVSAGWLNRSNFHHARGMTLAKVAQIGERVGANHEVGRQIVKACKHYGIEVVEVRPTMAKLDAAAFKRLTGWQGRTNQEQRDAAMCVFGR